MDSDTILELELLSRAALVAVDDASDNVLLLYERYRREALELNVLNAFTTLETFETMFPTLDQFATIERLDADFGARRGSAKLARQGLIEIYGWARGLRMAAQTFPSNRCHEP